MFGRLRVGTVTPSCICVWKVPIQFGDAYPGNVQKAIENCREMLPRKVAAESLKHFDNLMASLLEVPAGVRNALKNYLFMGEVNVKGDLAEDYLNFAMDLAAGMPLDKSLIVDGRSFNSRGSKGIGSTM